MSATRTNDDRALHALLKRRYNPAIPESCEVLRERLKRLRAKPRA
jgi:hypothetical protein